MKLSDFHFELPDELIAKHALSNRSQSRLLVVHPLKEHFSDHYFYHLPQLLRENDLLVFNNSRVIPARLFAQKLTGGKVEVLVERIMGATEALAHVGSNKKLNPPTEIILEDQSYAVIHERVKETLFRISFDPYMTLLERLQKIGHMPLPHYMAREDQLEDRERYQTVYSKVAGSVAAPTAGLHFDQSLLKELSQKGINTAEVTLHVGAGTFMPVRVDDIRNHQMHSEYMTLSHATCTAIAETKQKNGRVIAVGTTALRSLETAAMLAATNGTALLPYEGETNIFIYPGFNFRCVDALITNFHLPESTLLMLVSAFAGHEKIMKAYYYAIKEKYRFYSYGDAMFIEQKL